MPASASPGKGGSTTHASIEALLAANPGERNPKKIIRRLAREKVAYAKTKNWAGPPFCPREFASIFGIRCKEVTHDIGGDGRILLSRNGKLWIEYRSDRLPERQKFTIFHEFAHTLFPDYCEFLPYNQAGNDHLFDSEKKFEFLCDLAAAEMLLPFEDFTKDLDALTWLGLESIHELRKCYHASIDATTYRLVELAKSVGLAALFLTDQKGIHSGQGPLWVKNASHGKAFKSFIKPGTMPPANSIAIHCYRNNLETSQPLRETWWINGKPRTWLVQAGRLPHIIDNPEYPKVVALLFPSGYGKDRLGK